MKERFECDTLQSLLLLYAQPRVTHRHAVRQTQLLGRLAQVNCENFELMQSWATHHGAKYKHYEEAIMLYGSSRRTLAADYDAGKINLEQYQLADFQATIEFGKLTLAIGADLKEKEARQFEERRVKAMERANEIETQKICIRITGRLCPSK